MKQDARHSWARIAATALAVASIWIAPGIALAEGPIGTTGGPNVPFSGCYYYEHSNFGGARREIPAGIRRRYVGDSWNDKISSIACSSSCGLQVWEHRDMGGASKTFLGAIIFVGDAWNDRISSMEVVCH